MAPPLQEDTNEGLVFNTMTGQWQATIFKKGAGESISYENGVMDRDDYFDFADRIKELQENQKY